MVDGQGELTCRVEDSGPGFTYAQDRPTLTDNTAYSSRGIPLVRALCKSLTYYGTDNCVEAVYTWS